MPEMVSQSARPVNQPPSLSNVPELSFITEDIETVVGWCRESMPDVIIRQDSRDVIQFVRK